MATVIQIKRSANVGAPSLSDLVQGELAYSYDQSNDGVGAKLYIEVDNNSGNVIHTIGGKYYTDAVDGATSSNTANKIVKRDGSGNFSAGIITANLYGNANTATRLATTRYINLAGDATGTAAFDGSGNADITVAIAANSVALGTDTTGDYVSNVLAGTGIAVTGQGGETATPTVALTNTGVAASTYGGASQIPVITVDAQGRLTAAANASITVASEAFRSVAVSGQATIDADSATDTLTLANTNGIVIETNASTDTVSFSLSNTGVSATTYGGATAIPVLAVDAQGRITSASNASISTSFTLAGDSGANKTISGGDTLTISGGTGLTSVTSDTDTLTINLDNTAVTPSTYGGADKTAVFTVDAQGRLTAASNVTISIPSSALNTDVALGTQTSGAYVANLIAGTGITITGLGNEGTTPTITNSGVTQLTGTSNEIEVSGSTGSITIGLPDNVTIGQNLTVTGDLIVNGTALTVNTATVTVEDPLVKFGNANPADSLDIGFFGQYTSSGEKFAGLFRDASDSGKFKLFVDLTTDPTTNVINTANYTVATLVTNLTGGTVSGLTANIAVGDGGTGRGTLTTNSVLYGQGTSAVGMATGSAGQVLQLNNSGVPTFAGIDGGTY